jgi:ribosomal protein L16 Arg81 hydroxylase
MRRATANLADALSPVTPEAFLAEYWEQAPLSIERGDPGYYERLLTTEDVESIVAAAGPADASVELLGEGRGPAGAAPGRRDTPFDRYRRGATIRLKGIQRRWAPLQSLCRNLEQELGVSALANLYWTPPDSQGLRAHWDGHDVLVLQIAGSKRWRLYDPPVALPTDLPPTFAFERGRPISTPGSFRQWSTQPPAEAFGPEAPAREIELRAGDLLYLPRGHGHEARTGETLSIHVTLGLYAVTWADLLCLAVYQAAQADVRFRRALPVGFASEPEAGPPERAEFAALADAFHRAASDPTAAARAFTEMAERFVLGAPPVESGRAADLLRVEGIGPETPLRRRPGTVARLRSEPESLLLFFSGSWLRAPRVAGAALRFMLAAEEFTAASLPGPLDEASRLVLVRRLLREGFLTVASEG